MAKNTVKFVDLERTHSPIKQEMLGAISRVIDAEDFILGAETEKFEKEFARYCGAKECVSVASGTDALFLSLKAMGIGKGDEVIVPANTFISTALAVSYNGGTPVFADVEEGSFNLDAADLEKRITKKTKAIIPVHLYGQACDMGAISEVANAHSIQILEDSCQSHGAKYKGKKTPVLGPACFSFYPGKNLGSLGDAGAVATDDAELAERLRELRNYGSPKKYFHPIKGYNSRLDCVQAAVLRVKLAYLDRWTKSRRESAKKYDEIMQNFGNVILPREQEYAEHTYHVYAIRSKKRDALRQHLEKMGVITNIHYPTVIYEQDAYAELAGAKGSCPVSEKLSREILSLPMFPFMENREIGQVCDAIKSFGSGPK